MMGGDPLGLPQEDSFEGLVGGLMHDAGVSAGVAKMGIAEVQLRPDGLFFLRQCGAEVKQCCSLKSERFEMLVLGPEEFLCGAESTEEGLHLTTNTGKKHLLKCRGQLFGPWTAPDGFRIVGLRTKPDDRIGSRVVGVHLWPLPSARSHDTGAALLFASEHEFLYTLQRLLSQAQIDVNGFGVGGVTGLMMAAENGNVGAMRTDAPRLEGQAQRHRRGGLDGPRLCHSQRQPGRRGGAARGRTLAVQDGDSGAALRDALRHEHNSAARALLRAGFGTAPAGTFSLEDLGLRGLLEVHPRATGDGAARGRVRQAGAPGAPLAEGRGGGRGVGAEPPDLWGGGRPAAPVAEEVAGLAAGPRRRSSSSTRWTAATPLWRASGTGGR
ncbi:unnamed protein product [Prorocentrum cordatum]|uniref:Altered inheritance of mitochondria protein 24, mitochondrial n=1 Tax=Prorocentrum cordatum TaxID=2364126 RepID=A0ABN9UCY8_9DINO|nr:unnamed protein product [Polarella glacialis]